ncbi:hypothetical protein [Microbacterium enclense]|uniref:hypothetical protein n=1 Tax=Microbacterium enclense TaxID=993073 RepID=UPI003F81C6E5
MSVDQFVTPFLIGQTDISGTPEVRSAQSALRDYRDLVLRMADETEVAGGAELSLALDAMLPALNDVLGGLISQVTPGALRSFPSGRRALMTHDSAARRMDRLDWARADQTVQAAPVLSSMFIASVTDQTHRVAAALSAVLTAVVPFTDVVVADAPIRANLNRYRTRVQVTVNSEITTILPYRVPDPTNSINVAADDITSALDTYRLADAFTYSWEEVVCCLDLMAAMRVHAWFIRKVAAEHGLEERAQQLLSLEGTPAGRDLLPPVYEIGALISTVAASERAKQAMQWFHDEQASDEGL